MSLKEYNFSVKTTGTDYYTVQAESEEQAIQLIKEGGGYLQSSESEFETFYLDSVEELDEDDEDEH
jgi:hypothetical protein